MLLLLLRILEQRLDGAIKLLLAREPEELVTDDSLAWIPIQKKNANI